jgi:hypothetical protein
MIYTTDFIMSWFANSDCNLAIQSDDQVFLIGRAGCNQFYSEEELKKAVKREINLQLKAP